MSCLNLINGSFTEIQWSDNPNYNTGQVTINRQSDQIEIGRTNYTSLLLYGKYSYAVYGDNDYIALCKKMHNTNDVTYKVYIVDITQTTLSPTDILQVVLPSSMHDPYIHTSRENGRLTFFCTPIHSVENNHIGNMQIVRSDDGTVVCSGPSDIKINGNFSAEITATDLIIYHPSNSTDETTCNRPEGSLSISSNYLDFDEIILGGSNSSSSETKTVDFTNDGNDCITINSISQADPFSVITPLPITLDHGETTTIEVKFEPTSSGTFNEDLEITSTPQNGDDSFRCRGSAREAVASMRLSSHHIDFGTVPHPNNSASTDNFIIYNNGDEDIEVTIPAPSPHCSSFSWNPSGSIHLAVETSQVIKVTFTTPGNAAAPTCSLTITATTSVGGNSLPPETITFDGAGCIANGVISLPSNNGVMNFGDVEYRFRTVKIFEVLNVGDGILSFEARITHDPDNLFGLILDDGDITNTQATRTYNINPTHACGNLPIGDGKQSIGVSFYAHSANFTSSVAAILEITDNNRYVYTYNLQAQIIAPIPVHAVLVFDKSGSMNDEIGQRNKIDAARSAGKLFINLLRPDRYEIGHDSMGNETRVWMPYDRASIVSFNQVPSNDIPLGDLNNHGVFYNALNNLHPTGMTNIAGGVILAKNEFPDSTPPSNIKQIIIALTDGKENVSFKDDSETDSPWYTLSGRDTRNVTDNFSSNHPSDPLPTPQNCKVYSIGIGAPEDIDAYVLDTLASATHASFNQITDMSGDDYFALEKYYTQIFMDSTNTAIIQDPTYTINPGQMHTFDFEIFPGDLHAMVTVYDHAEQGRLPFYLLSPSGKEINNINLPEGFQLNFSITPSARVVKIIFPHDKPERYQGTWKVIVEHSGYVCYGEHQKSKNFLPEKCTDSKNSVTYGIVIGAGSNLRMQAYVEPNTKYIGDSIRLNAFLKEAGININGANISVQAQSPSGYITNIELQEVNDGYEGILDHTFESGVYKFTFHAEGLLAKRPYSREKQVTKTVFNLRKPEVPNRPVTDQCCNEIIYLLKRIYGKKNILRKKDVFKRKVNKF